MKSTCLRTATSLALILFSSLTAAAPFGIIAESRITEPCSPSGAGGGYSCGPGITFPAVDDQSGSGIIALAVVAQHPTATSRATAAAYLDPGNAYLPVLTASASSVAGHGAFSQVETINLYTYTGVDGFTLEGTAFFHGTTSGIATSMFGAAALISVDDYPAGQAMDDFDDGFSPQNCFGECFSPLDNDSVFATNGGEQTLDFTLSTVLNNGDQFYIWAKFGGLSVGGGNFDGLGTTTFSLNTSDISSTAVVPLPAAAWLFASALGALLMARGRHPRTR